MPPRKRKRRSEDDDNDNGKGQQIREEDDTGSSSNVVTIDSDDCGTEETGNTSKRSKTASKASFKSTNVRGQASIAAADKSTPIHFPIGNLEGSAHVARHAVMSRELQATIDEACEKWEAAIKASTAIKDLMDRWAKCWKDGD
jgi:hypothetical protein